ncbi:MAG: ATP-binding cassette domain-containing protein [Candidatus Nanoarchaeia archaeon]|nr:ATP-binding cassette domain-containing protein [Candidatus Nanoarchaeia archaeon]
MTQNIIEVKNLKKMYKTHEREPGLINAAKSIFKRNYRIDYALRGINLSINKGEIVGFIGPNGAGKSTTIKILSGILYPDEGEVNVLGFVPWKERVKYVQNIGVVFGQKTQLWWDLPAIDTFELNKDLYKIPKEVFKRRLKFMMKVMNVERVIKKPVRDLSLGERMKCQTIAALLHKPKLVFLDEPTIGLDVVAKERYRNFILETNERFGTTFLITTHDMQDVEKLCKRVIIINHGKIVYDGPLKEIKEKYMTTKILDVKFDGKPVGFKCKGCIVLKRGRCGLKIKVDLSKKKIRDVIDYLIGEFEVLDINIQDTPIEEIIQKIYQEKND